MKKEYENLKVLLMANKYYWNRVNKISKKINLLNNSTFFYINKNILSGEKDTNQYDLIILSTGKRYLETEVENLKNIIIEKSKENDKLVIALYNYVLTEKDRINAISSKNIEIYAALNGELISQEKRNINDENFNIEQLLDVSVKEYNKTLKKTKNN